MSFFSDTHVTQAGLEGSLGPSVGLFELTQQSIRQQYRVGSSMAFESELQNRWIETLQHLEASGQNFPAPSRSDAYIRYAELVRGGGVPEGQNIYSPLSYDRAGIPQGSDEVNNIRRANEAIRQLNNPQIKTFEQILDEVSAMQRGIEEESASMHERGPTGTFAAELLGGAIGSFTLRDPLNLITLPLGAGRTIATRIGTDMLIAAGTTAMTEFGSIQHNRELAGLPEHNPFFDIAASALGAGIFRGALEGVGHGLGRLRSIGDVENLDFNVRDAQLQQMFASIDTPTSRAASSLLDDAIVLERSNPYGDGRVAGFRWQAELEATARALNGEETPSLELPPLPSEYIDRHLSFQSVKETAPELWNELETARQRLAQLDDNIAEVSSRELTIPDAVRLVDEEAAAKLDKLDEIINNPDIPEPTRVAADIEANAIISRVGHSKIVLAADAADTAAKFETKNLRASRKAANKQYRAAYQKVEAEAVRLEHAEAAKRSIAQVQSIDVLGPHVVSEPMTGPMTRRDFVEAHTARVEEGDAGIPARAEAVNELEVDPETNTVNIGTETPVSADFKVPLDEGELSVKQILDDLAEDQRLEEAVKGCAI